VKYTDLVTIDLSEFDRPGGKEKLAAQLKNAVHEVGNDNSRCPFKSQEIQN
jgi:hypothetical protein